MTLAAVSDTITTYTPTHLLPDTIARAAWTTIAEPGDPCVGALIALLGAAGALHEAITGDADSVDSIPLAALRESVREHFSLPAVLAVLHAGYGAGYEVLTPSDEAWPTQVDILGTRAPIALWVRGNPSVLVAPSVALTGTSAASAYGRHVSIDLASGLADRGYVIAAGRPGGIEGAALASVLAFGGRALAVLPCDTDPSTPAPHAALLAKVTTRGAVVCELPPSSGPSPSRSRRRDELLVALAEKTVLVETDSDADGRDAATVARRLQRPCATVPGLAMTGARNDGHHLVRELSRSQVTTIDDVDAL